jgi:threonylcarbamoyladenosine tRNA methylthiotransferase MtaB
VKRVGVATLGCRVNQFDSAAIIAGVGDAGHVTSADEACDLYVVNTCNVTAAANAGARKLVRKLHRDNPAAAIVVTGCYAEVAPGEVAKLPGVVAVVGVRQRPRVVEVVRGWLTRGEVPEPAPDAGDPNAWARWFPLPGEGAEGRTRVILKVQEGCDARCSFCIIPRSRGPGRSQPEDAVLAHLNALAARGFREVVLAGVSLGAWGHDLSPPTTLAALVRRIVAEAPMPRLRLSSLEPWHVGDDLIAALAEGRAAGVVCDHLHLPLQSGSDRVLAAMRRPYTRRQWLDVVARARDALPGMTLGTDVIVGFPGEDDAAFADTVTTLEAGRFAYLHVFPFSPRPGTEAGEVADLVPERVGRARSTVLRAMSVEARRAALDARVGSRVRVLVEEPARGGGDDVMLRGLTDGYLPARVPPGVAAPGQLVHLRVSGVAGDHLIGEVAA